MSRKGRNWSQSLNKAEIRKPALRPAAISGFLLLLLFFCLLSAGSLLASSRGIKAVSRKMPVKPQERVAVVIGNGEYSSSPLKNPVNDARAMADLLEKLKFKVDLVVNGDRRKMLKTLSRFSRQLRKADVGLFYYAGHGIQVKGRNYLIPVDATLETESDVEFEALDLGRVLGKMDDAGCPLNIVILDACRDNPFSRSFRSAGKGLAMVDAPRGTLLAFATAPGSVAADGNGRNGIYTRNLLTNMDQPGLSIEEVFKQVRIKVVEETNGRQTPWESSSLMGDFYFKPAGQNTPPPVRKAQAGTAVRKAAEATPAPAPKPKPKPKPKSAAVPKPKPKPVAVKKKPVQTASLEKPAPSKPAVKKPSLSPEIKNYLRMIHSGNSREQRAAAKRIYRGRIHKKILLEAIRKELLKGYSRNPRDRYHVDAMAWFCKVLGSSGNHSYASTLNQVAGSSSSRKLRKYAAKSLKMLR
jgi:hypothetical protein